jgi:hemerythrin superfamily protein
MDNSFGLLPSNPSHGGIYMATQSTQRKSSGSSQSKSKSSRARPKSGSRSGRRTKRAETKPMDAIRLLKDDHKQVRQWFEQFDKSEDDAEKQELADQICKALTVHAQIEEEIFYPAAYEALDEDGDDIVDEATVEHATAKQLIAEIMEMSAGEPLFDAKVKVLGEYVDHHVQEEENELFPECKDAGMDLKALGEMLAARKEELMAA